MDARVDGYGGRGGQPVLARMPVTEFVERVVDGAREHGLEAAWFVGAGCSVTSGIPSPSVLVAQWLDILERRRKYPGEGREDWLRREFGTGLDWSEPAAHYDLVFHRCYPSADERQTEIERICMLGDPGIGYATLAQVLSHPEVGDKLNTVLTANFDDLLAHALYDFAPREARPRVISHEALARFQGARSRRPTIVKIHSDGLLAARNTSEETRRLAAAFQDHVSKVLQRKAIIFVGYGGRDESIPNFFDTALEDAPGAAIYWVGDSLPPSAMLDWLALRKAYWVELGDFDALMCLFRKKLELPLPDEAIMQGRWEKLRTSWAAFEVRFVRAPQSEAKAALEPFLDDFRKGLPPGWAQDLEAHRISKPDPDAADVEGQKAQAASPEAAKVVSDDAATLENPRNGSDGAPVDDRGALAGDPNHVAIFCKLANFLWQVRGDGQGALELYERALQIQPDSPALLGTSAQILLALGRREQGLTRLYQALPGALGETPPDEPLLAQLLYGLLAHDRPKAEGALASLKGLIGRGVRTPGWSFEGTIWRAQDEGHPEIGLLRDLAKVLAYGADPSLLDAHVAYRMAEVLVGSGPGYRDGGSGLRPG